LLCTTRLSSHRQSRNSELQVRTRKF
jgi:hypothetical protein